MTVAEESSPLSTKREGCSHHVQEEGETPNTHGVKRSFNLDHMQSCENANASISRVKFRTRVRFGINTMDNLTSERNRGICSKIFPSFQADAALEKAALMEHYPVGMWAKDPPGERCQH